MGHRVYHIVQRGGGGGTAVRECQLQLRTIVENCGKIAGKLRENLRKSFGAVTKPPAASTSNTSAQGTPRAPTRTRGGRAKSNCGKSAGNCENCAKLRTATPLPSPPLQCWFLSLLLRSGIPLPVHPTENLPPIASVAGATVGGSTLGRNISTSGRIASPGVLRGNGHGRYCHSDRRILGYDIDPLGTEGVRRVHTGSAPAHVPSATLR